MVEVVPQPDPRPLERGAAVGRYTILAPLGSGGVGEVFAAFDPELDRKVALKLLRPRGDDDERAQTRLLREAKAMARLSHPSVVAVHDVGAFGARVFVAMDFVDGLTLKDWLAEAPRSRAEILGVFTAAARGLAAAHAAGLVHRDFKPGNVMIARDGSVRVMDFGLARELGDKSALTSSSADLRRAGAGDLNVTLTATGELMGTPLYMAPEQFKAEATDARTDQFSFCVALYEALYGTAPFGDANLAAIAGDVLAGRVRPAPPRAAVPTWLRRVLLRGLAVAPDARWPSMADLVAALARDPARTRRQLGLTLAAASVVALSLATLVRAGGHAAPLCRDGETRFQGIWETAANGPRREVIRAAFLASGAPAAAEVWERVAGLLDRYVGDWVAMYGDACEATQVRHTQLASTLDLRMTCLAERRTAVAALTDVLARADRDVVSNGVDAVHALPGLARCADVNQLRIPVEPPRDEATRARVADVRARLAAAKALNDAGKHEIASQRARGLIAEARGIGYGPLLAETLAMSINTYIGGRERSNSEAEIEEALWTSLANARDDIAVDAASTMAYRASWATDRQDEGQAWSKLAYALLDRLGPERELRRAWLSHNEGTVLLAQNRAAEALPKLLAALAIKEKVLPADDPDAARTVGAVGDAMHELGRTTEALAWTERAYLTFVHAYGAASSEAAYTLSNQGEYMIDAGRAAEAVPVLRDATARWQAHVGPANPNLAYPLTALGRALLATGRAAEAVAPLSRALDLRAHEPNQGLVAETTFALGRALWDSQADEARGRALATKARAEYAHAEDKTHTSAVDAWLGAHARAR